MADTARSRTHADTAALLGRMSQLEDALLMAADANEHLTSKLFEMESALSANAQLLQEKTTENETLLQKVEELGEVVLTSNRLVLEARAHITEAERKVEQEKGAKEATVQNLQAALRHEQQQREDEAKLAAARIVHLSNRLDEVLAELPEVEAKAEARGRAALQQAVAAASEQAQAEWGNKLKSAVQEYEMKLAQLGQATARILQEKGCLERVLVVQSGKADSARASAHNILLPTPEKATPTSPARDTTFSDVEMAALRTQLETLVTTVGSTATTYGGELISLRTQIQELNASYQQSVKEVEMLRKLHAEELEVVRGQAEAALATAEKVQHADTDTQLLCKRCEMYLREALAQHTTELTLRHEKEMAIAMIQLEEKCKTEVFQLKMQLDHATKELEVTLAEHAHVKVQLERLDGDKSGQYKDLEHFKIELQAMREEKTKLLHDLTLQLSIMRTAFEKGVATAVQVNSANAREVSQQQDEKAKVTEIINGLNEVQVAQIEQMRVECWEPLNNLRREVARLDELHTMQLSAWTEDQVAECVEGLRSISDSILSVENQLSRLYFPTEELRARLKAAETELQIDLATANASMTEALLRAEQLSQKQRRALEAEILSLRKQLSEAKMIGSERTAVTATSLLASVVSSSEKYVCGKMPNGELRVFRTQDLAAWVKHILTAATDKIEHGYSVAFEKAVAVLATKAAHQSIVAEHDSQCHNQNPTTVANAYSSAELMEKISCAAGYRKCALAAFDEFQRVAEAKSALAQAAMEAQRLQLFAGMYLGGGVQSHFDLGLGDWDQLSIDDVCTGYETQIESLHQTQREQLLQVQHEHHTQMMDLRRTLETQCQQQIEEVRNSISEEHEAAMAALKADMEQCRLQYAKTVSVLLQENNKEEETQYQAFQTALQALEAELHAKDSERSRHVAETVELRQRVAEVEQDARNHLSLLDASQRKLVEANMDIQQLKQDTVALKLDQERVRLHLQSELEHERKKVDKLREAARFSLSTQTKQRLIAALQDASATKIADANHAVVVVEQLLNELKQLKSSLRHTSLLAAQRLVKLQATEEHADRLEKEVGDRHLGSPSAVEGVPTPKPFEEEPAPTINVRSALKAAAPAPPLPAASSMAETLTNLRLRARLHRLQSPRGR